MLIEMVFDVWLLTFTVCCHFVRKLRTYSQVAVSTETSISFSTSRLAVVLLVCLMKLRCTQSDALWSDCSQKILIVTSVLRLALTHTLHTVTVTETKIKSGKKKTRKAKLKHETSYGN